MTSTAPLKPATPALPWEAGRAAPARIAQVFSLQVVTKILAGVTAILLIRVLEAEELARYTLAFSAALMLTDALSGALNRVYIVGYRRLPVQSAFAPFIGFQLVATLTLAIVGVTLGGVEGGLWIWTLLLSLGITLSEFSKTAFQRELRFLRYSLIDCSRALLFVVSTVALAWLAGSRLRASTVLFLQGAAFLITFLVFFGSRVEFTRSFAVRDMVAPAVGIARGPYRVLFAYFVLDSFFGKIDPFVLQYLAGPAMVASFSAAFRYFLVLTLALASVEAVLLPLVQRARSAADLDALVRQITHRLVWLAPLILVGALLARWTLPWLNGGRYPESVLIFQILAGSAIVQFAFSPYVMIVLRFEAFAYLCALVAAAVAISVLGNLVLLPWLGPSGAAVSYLLAHGFVSVMAFVRARSLIRGLTPEVELA